MAIEIEQEDFVNWMNLILKRFDMLDNKVDRLAYVKNGINDEQYLDNQDVMLITKLSLRTLQRLRTEGKIPYKKDGKCLYKASDVQMYLNYRKSTK